MEDITNINIDLNISNRGELNEAYLSALGGQIEFLLKMMFGGFPKIPVNIRGTGRELNSFIKAMAGEKKYMDAFRKYGLGDQRTFSSQYKLNSAVQGFEKTTGLKWPVK